MNQINKQALHPNKEGWYVDEIYSKTEFTDELGRWQRRLYFNGLLVGVISGHVEEHEQPKSKPSFFFAIPRFPLGDNESYNASVSCSTYHEAEAYIKEMFEDFLRVVNEKPKVSRVGVNKIKYTHCVVCGKHYSNLNNDSDTCYECREPHAKINTIGQAHNHTKYP